MGKTIYEQLDEEFQCEHDATEIRYKVDSLGRRFYVRQCLGCGAQVGNSIPYADIPDLDSVPQFDDAIRARWWNRRQIRQHEIAAEWRAGREEQYRREDAEWWAKYSEYLQTPEWEAKRKAVFKRDNNWCQACYPGCRVKATEVHHVSYKHAFDEPLFDLVAVCHHCHERLHNGSKVEQAA